MACFFQPSHAQDDQHWPEQDPEERRDPESTSSTKVSIAEALTCFSLLQMMMFHFWSVFLSPDCYGSSEQQSWYKMSTLVLVHVKKPGWYRHCRKKIIRRVLKKNPLKNLRIMLKLNPYSKTARRHAILKHNPEVRAALTGHKTLLAWLPPENISSLHRSRLKCWNPRRSLKRRWKLLNPRHKCSRVQY